MSNTWNHPRLGEFDQDDIWWHREITLPLLDSFTYNDFAVPGSKHGPFELILECDEDDEQPTEEMGSLAEAILDNGSRLMPMALEGIWSDLNGRGPHSGMWWHGDLPNAHRGGNWASAVYENLSTVTLPIPACPSDLMKILEPANLTIRRDFSPPGQWLAEFNFDAGFDLEHGIGVLTNGLEILGIGYSADTIRFER